MESDLVNEKDDDSNIGINPESAISLIKKYFDQKRNYFILKAENLSPPFWSIKYMFKEIEINIEGDSGFNCIIAIDGKQFPLWQFDKMASNATKTNQKNIQLVLSIVDSFLAAAISKKDIP